MRELPGAMTAPASGDVIRFQCTVLPGGGRMLTYTDVTDIVRGVGRWEQPATALG